MTTIQSRVGQLMAKEREREYGQLLAREWERTDGQPLVREKERAVTDVGLIVEAQVRSSQSFSVWVYPQSDCPSVAKSPVLKRASPFKRAFGGNRTFFARFSVISPVFCGFFNIERYLSIKVQDLLKINQI